jgi:excisionase family DNA binding protein
MDTGSNTNPTTHDERTQPSALLAIDRDTMNLEEFATRMGISLTVAYELARKNDLPIPVIRVGRQYRFSRRAYETLMDGQHTEIDGDAA